MIAVVHTKIRRIDHVFDNLAVGTQLGDIARMRDAELIQPIARMHRQHPLRAERTRDLDHRPQPSLAEHTEQLMLDARRIRQRPQYIKHRADANGAPHRHHMAHRMVIGLGEHEAEIRLGNTCLNLRWFQIHDHARLAQHIGAAGSTAGGDIPVLGDLHPARRSDNRRRRGHIKKTGAIAAGADRIDQHTAAQIRRFSERAHHLRSRRHLGNRLALDSQRRQKSADRCRVGLAAHQRQHHLAHQLGGQLLPAYQQINRCLHKKLLETHSKSGTTAFSVRLHQKPKRTPTPVYIHIERSSVCKPVSGRGG